MLKWNTKYNSTAPTSVMHARSNCKVVQRVPARSAGGRAGGKRKCKVAQRVPARSTSARESAVAQRVPARSASGKRKCKVAQRVAYLLEARVAGESGTGRSRSTGWASDPWYDLRSQQDQCQCIEYDFIHRRAHSYSGSYDLIYPNCDWSQDLLVERYCLVQINPCSVLPCMLSVITREATFIRWTMWHACQYLFYDTEVINWNTVNEQQLM